MRKVVLCDEAGQPTGTMEIFAAHENGGHLHRAFSAFVFRNDMSQLMIQQRSPQKPVFPNLWANTCCSHPYPGEDIVAAGERRLTEELGFTVPLRAAEAFVYRADDPATGRTEHEYDTVLVGHLLKDVPIVPNPDEVAAYKWNDVEAIERELHKHAKQFGPWVAKALAIALAGK